LSRPTARRESALGPEIIKTLAQRSGLSEEEITLDQVSRLGHFVRDLATGARTDGPIETVRPARTDLGVAAPVRRPHASRMNVLSAQSHIVATSPVGFCEDSDNCG
jgi:hypothetical protein